MCQHLISPDFASRLAPKDVSPTVLSCVALASGAAFGIAALAALQHLGLDFGSINADLIAGHAPKARSVAAWWAWCLVPVAAFLVGPLSLSLTRTLAANWWLPRGLRLCATAAAVLGLAAIAGLRPAPSTLTFTTNAALGLVVVTGSTVLAWLGARVVGVGLKRSASPLRRFAPIPAAQPARGGGCANSGLPFLRFRHRNALVPGAFSLGRLVRAAGLGLVVLAAVSALGATTVLLDSLAPGAMRKLAASHIPTVGAAGHARTLVLALLPTEERRPVVMPPVAMLDAPPPKPVEAPAPRQKAISAAVGYGGAAVSESELTFAKGYSRRRAARLAANMTSLPSIAQLAAAIAIKKVRPASLRLTQDRRVPRAAADSRYFADNRSFADDRRLADIPQRASRHARGPSRAADRQPRYADHYNVYDRQTRHDRRHRGREHYGYGNDWFARAEPGYPRF